MSFGPNLANATNTLADTSARHHKVSRVSVDWYNMLTDPLTVATNKDDFRAIRFEITLGIGRPYHQLGYSLNDRKGPPPVFTNTAPMRSGGPNDLMSWYITLWDCRSNNERKAHLKTACVVKGQRFYPSELYFGGIAMTDGDANSMNGDTALTVFIGGVITIRNGRFPIRCNDLIQWYFDEEADAGCFDNDGLRVARETAIDGSQVDLGRDQLDAYSLKIRDRTYGERALTKGLVRIKPFRLGIDGLGATLGDRARIFAKANIGAGPHEMVDIKVCRQSM